MPEVTEGVQSTPLIRIAGLTGKVYPEASPNRATTMTNVDRTLSFNTRKRLGKALFNTGQISSGTVALTGLVQATYSGGSTLQIETAGTKVYTDDGTTRSDVTGALTLTDNDEARLRHAFIDDKVVATNGVNATWTKGSAGNAAALSGVLWTTCGDILVHNNVLVVLDTTESGTRYPTRIRWCDIDYTTRTIDITNWPLDNLYEVYAGGSAIVGGVDAFGRLLVFKQDGLYPCRIFVEDGFIESEVVKEEVVRGIEFIARNSVIGRPEFAWGVARDGMYRITPNPTGAGFSYVNVIDAENRAKWDELNKARIQYAVSWFRVKDKQVRTLLSSSSNTAGHDQEWVYEWETGEVWVDDPTDAENFGASVVSGNTEYDFIGTTNGYVLLGDNGTQDRGQDFSWQLDLSPNDLGAPNREKNIINIHTVYVPQGEASVAFSVQIDEGRASSESGTLTLDTGLTWDSGLDWDDTSLEYSDQGLTSVDTFFVNRTAKTVAPSWQSPSDVELVGYWVEFEVLE